MSDQVTPTQAVETTSVTPVQSTQEEPFDQTRAMALIEKLRNEVKELKPKAKQAEELAAAVKQKEEAEMTELQKLTKRLADTEAALKSTQRAALVAQAAAKHNLPQQLADRLKGETPEELEADAVELAKLLTPSDKPKQPGPVSPGANGSGGESRDQALKRLGLR